MYYKIHCTDVMKKRNGLNILPCENYESDNVDYKKLNII